MGRPAALIVAKSYRSGCRGSFLASPRPDALSPSPSPGWAHNTRRYTHLLAGGPGPSGRVYAMIVPVVITGSGITAK